MDARARELARIIWDHLVLSGPLSKADVILALGSHDTRVAVHAARLWHEGWSPLVVVSGGRGKITSGWDETEARVFGRVVREHGVPADALVLEETATNTGENITASRRLLDGRGVAVRSGILVAKPYMTRRALATARRQWPGVAWTPSAPELGFDAFGPDERQFIELMVGDLQRMVVYAERGYQVPMPVPAAAWAAYEELARLGYDRHVIR
ncbi:YdcF family protein [Actinomadura madurae]|uniref:YdcF family protein n=1 Tax=Actinomadura madurae TaxID=1993 RepID=UPI0020D228EF|nr:YdcF family protein [Actinomadura madurae]MCP9955152.1 YdcF family protein [Actinomadura madurae]MCP9971882.1 YdcF family protein [Actinomadura madurae]MCP9984392.1 YdcF family protein [Actinomadura madurae]MCQ0004060.1 YdcF family protein [Actinomadura madurae]MCQ0020580.1 YdcF family protein [Actinomadura madurae]